MFDAATFLLFSLASATLSSAAFPSPFLIIPSQAPWWRVPLPRYKCPCILCPGRLPVSLLTPSLQGLDEDTVTLAHVSGRLLFNHQTVSTEDGVLVPSFLS